MRTSMILLACVAACGPSRPTIGRLKQHQPELTAQVLDGMDKAFAAVLAAPRPAVGAKCERAKLTEALDPYDGKPTPGNTERLSVRGQFGSLEGEKAKWDFSGDGPVGLWGSRLQTDDDTLISDTGETDFLSVANTKQILIERGDNSFHRELFLVDWPAGTIACGFAVEARERPRYDPYTGTDWKTGTSDGDRVSEELVAQLHARFGIGQVAAEVALPADTRAFYVTIANGLAQPELPACTDADPAGSVRTTTKRLDAYAGLPLLETTADNYDMEPASSISPQFLDLVDRDKLSSRDKTIAALRAAPATVVIDIVKVSTAFRTDEDHYNPGFAAARTVRFDPTGKPVCERRIEVENPDSMNVTYSGTVDMGLFETSRKDLFDQIEKALASST